MKKLFALATVVASLAVSAVAGNASASTQHYKAPPTVSFCYHDTTFTVLNNPLFVFVFNFLHPGATSGACATPVVTAVERHDANPGVALCNESGGLFFDNVLNEADSYSKGNRPAFEVLNAAAPGTENTNPNANNTGYFTCVLPKGAVVVPDVLADSNGWLYPLPAYQGVSAGSTVIYPAYNVG